MNWWRVTIMHHLAREAAYAALSDQLIALTAQMCEGTNAEALGLEYIQAYLAPIP